MLNGLRLMETAMQDPLLLMCVGFVRGGEGAGARMLASTEQKGR